MPTAILSTDPDIGPLARTAIGRAIDRALPGWQLRGAGREGAVSAAEAARADALILAGGRLGLDDAGAVRRAGLTARLRDRPVVHLDVRGPSADHRRTRALVRGADLLVVRGPWSAARLAASGAATPFRVGAPLLWAATADADTSQDDVLLAALRAPGDAARLADLLRRAAAATGARVALARWRTSRAPAADLALTRAVADRVAGAVVLDSAPDHDACFAQAASARAAFVQDTAGAVTALAAGTPLVVQCVDPDIAALARRCGQSVVGAGQDPRDVGDLLAAAARGRGATPEALASERARATATLALLRLVCERGSAPGAPPLPLVPGPEARAR